EENADYWKDTEKPPKKSRDFMESSDALEAFRAWAQGQGAELPASDHVMLFTGHNLTYGGSVSNAGLAYLGSACNPDYYFSIVEEYFEFRDVAIAAHELGHSLGARHDMDGNTCLSFNRYIMTPRFKFPSRRKAKNPWLFSQCSVDYFVEFIDGLDKNGTNCFVTKDSATDQKEIQPFLVSLPGEMYAGDDLCRIGNGPDSHICRDKHTDGYSNICYAGIDCFIPTENKCAPQLPPDGFSCGDRKWCLNGTCTSSAVAPATQGDDCPFGDDPGLIGGKTCADRMLTSRYDCYKDVFRAKCCASCKRYRRNLPGCEYGDLFELCKSDQCTKYEEDYARENCCDTCAELLFTIPSTIATTTTASTTTTESATAGPGGNNDLDKSAAGSKRNTTSHGGSDDGAGNGRGVGSREDEGGDNREGEIGDGGEGEDRGEDGNEDRRRRKFYGRRRNYIDSDDSDESGGSSKSWYGARRRNNYHWTNGKHCGAAWLCERMVQIHSLLDGMRKSRDYTRLQRLRMLIYILDKTRNDDLADLILGFNGEGFPSREAGLGRTTHLPISERVSYRLATELVEGEEGQEQEEEEEQQQQQEQ
ncbi:A disintegrin and metalloproteinase with thrombospondin motifs 1, partial [Elysia marginata]